MSGELLAKRRREQIAQFSLDDHVALEDACRSLKSVFDVQALQEHISSWKGSVTEFEAVKSILDAAHTQLCSLTDRKEAVALNTYLEKIGYVIGGIIRDDHGLR